MAKAINVTKKTTKLSKEEMLQIVNEIKQAEKTVSKVSHEKLWSKV